MGNEAVLKKDGLLRSTQNGQVNLSPFQQEFSTNKEILLVEQLNRFTNYFLYFVFHQYISQLACLKKSLLAQSFRYLSS
ncbi:hypothetical protein [Pedobacter sp. MW01-1-1]|uniref:hypothetical protein n=1 Tax=Pedobacter sp. MW01-1-1 TaxID=3383027 RepID=UPI003FEF46A8